MSGPSNYSRHYKDAKPFLDEGDLAAFYRARGQDLASGFTRYSNGDYGFDLLALLKDVESEMVKLTTAMKAIDMVARAAGEHARIVRNDPDLTIARVRAFWQIRCLRGKMPHQSTARRAGEVVEKLPERGTRWEQAKKKLQAVAEDIGNATGAAEQAALQSRFVEATKEYNGATQKLLELLTPNLDGAARDAEGDGPATTGDLFRPEQDYARLWADLTKGMSPGQSGRVTPKGDLVRERRKALKWSQQRLSDETRKYRPDRDLGVGVRTIRRVEAGSSVNVRTLGYIAIALGEDLNNLVQTSGSQP